MKLWLFISVCVCSLSVATAQDFRGENLAFLKFETIQDGMLEYESNKFTIELNEEQTQFSFSVDLQSFRPIDNSATMTLFNDIFDEEVHSDMTYKADFGMLKRDAQTDAPQLIELNGILWVGAIKIDQPFRVEMRLMDRFLFINFDLVTPLSKMGIEIPEKYKKKLSGKIHVQVLNGKLIEGFR